VFFQSKAVTKLQSVGLKETADLTLLSRNTRQRIVEHVVSIFRLLAHSAKRSVFAQTQSHLKMRVWSP
jgi:hypothetical protein